MEQNFCSFCGAPVGEGNFCGKCGHPITGRKDVISGTQAYPATAPVKGCGQPGTGLPPVPPAPPVPPVPFPPNSLRTDNEIVTGGPVPTWEREWVTAPVNGEAAQPRKDEPEDPYKTMPIGYKAQGLHSWQDIPLDPAQNRQSGKPGYTVPLDPNQSKKMGYTVPLDPNGGGYTAPVKDGIHTAPVVRGGQDPAWVPPTPPTPPVPPSHVEEKPVPTGKKPPYYRLWAAVAAGILAVVAILVLAVGSVKKNRVYPAAERVLMAHFAEKIDLNPQLPNGGRDSVISIEFTNSLKGSPRDAIDVSEMGNRSVLFWVEKSGAYYKAYIGATKGAYAPEDCSELFRPFRKVETVNFSDDFHTDNVTTMAGMFEGCARLNYVRMYNMNTAKLKDMSRLAADCVELVTFEAPYLNTSGVEDMSYAFHNCVKLSGLKIDEWVTTSVVSAEGMFLGTDSLSNVKANLDLTCAERFADFMDGGDHVNGRSWENVTPLVTCRMNMGKFTAGLGKVAGAASNITSLTFLPKLDSVPGKAIDISDMASGNVMMWCDGGELFVAGRSGVYAPGDCGNLFRDLVNLESFHSNGAFHTENATTMSHMFFELKNLREVDAKGWDTSNVKNMMAMFHDCQKLEKITGVGNWKTGAVTDMSFLFSNCHKLETLDLRYFNTSKVKSMEAMFQNCYALELLNVENFVTSNVTNMGWMFFHCEGLKELKVTSFDTRNVTSMYGMFYGCQALSYLDLSKFDTGKCEDFSYMLSGTPNLKNVVGKFDVSGWKKNQSFMDNGDTLGGNAWRNVFR